MITQGSYTAVSQENGTQVTQVEFDPENPRGPKETQGFHKARTAGVCSPFKSIEPESKRPRICLEEGRAATGWFIITISSHIQMPRASGY